MDSLSDRTSRCCLAVGIVCACLVTRIAVASEAGQGVFHTTLDDHPVHCSPGVPITTGYVSTFSFDDKPFAVAALNNPIEATVGPIDLVLPAVDKITTYKIKHQLAGIRPGTVSTMEVDRDVMTVKCVDATQF